MRRRARECALQILYQLDLSAGGGNGIDGQMLAAELERYFTHFDPVTPEEREFAERLVRGVIAEREAIDAAIAGASQHWKLTRMDNVDRNVLRLAAYEILRCPDVPRSASINEAVEIAKRFSGQESAAFINGILDQLKRAGEP